MLNSIRRFLRIIRLLFDRISHFRRAASAKECTAVLDWVLAQDLPPGTAREFTLPADLAHVTENGVIHALHTTDDRYCVLLKTFIGWKGNFTGTLWCNKPLRPEEVFKGAQDQRYISIVGYYPFEELYIRKQHTDHWFEVYFELH